MQGDHFQATFTITEEDLFQYFRYHRLSKNPKRFLWWGYYPICVWGATAAVHESAQSHGLSPSGVMLLTLLGGMCAAVAYPLCQRLLPMILRRRVKRYARENPNSVGARTFESSPEGVSWTWASGESALTWAAVQSIASTHGYVYLYLGPQQAFIIPRRAFTSPEAAEAFLQAASESHAAATAPTR